MVSIFKVFEQLRTALMKATAVASTSPSAPEYVKAAGGVQSFGQLDPFIAGDIFIGARFCATMQIRTPLRVLLRHGQTHKTHLEAPPVIAREMWEGIWIWEVDPTFDLARAIEERVASDIGNIPDDGAYLAFLIKVRKIVESDGSIEDRRAALWDELIQPKWTEYCLRLGGAEAVLEKFFPRFISTIKGLPMSAVEALWEIGLTTACDLNATPDADLLSIKGIGDAKLQQIRRACKQASQPECMFIDNVIR